MAQQAIVGGSRRKFSQPGIAPVQRQNPIAATQNVFAAQEVSAAPDEAAIAGNDLNQSITPANRQAATALKGVLLGSYLLFLLLFALYIARKMRQREQQRKRRLELARLRQQMQESVLDSDESIR
jgi:hypothetical protein